MTEQGELEQFKEPSLKGENTMRRLVLLVGCLALVTTALLPRPALAINCTTTCSGMMGQFCFQQYRMGCGAVCAPEGWPCTCGCVDF